MPASRRGRQEIAATLTASPPVAKPRKKSNQSWRGGQPRRACRPRAPPSQGGRSGAAAARSRVQRLLVCSENKVRNFARLGTNPEAANRLRYEKIPLFRGHITEIDNQILIIIIHIAIQISIIGYDLNIEIGTQITKKRLKK